MTALTRAARLGLLLLWFALTAQAATRTSLTIDEPLHITSGYACLRTGDYRLVEEHPPLVKMLEAAPLLLARPPLPDPRTISGWADADLLQVTYGVLTPYRPLDRIIYPARVPVMLLGVLLAALVYRWAAELWGTRAGLLALALFAFDPNLLAHGGVAATDLGATLAIFAAMYTFWRWLSAPDGPHRRAMLLAAVVLGLALTVKTTVLLLLPVLALCVLVCRPAGRPLKPYLLQSLAAGGVAFLALWAVYRFEVGPLPGGSLIVPAPDHWRPWLTLREHMHDGHTAFLMGHNYRYGRWDYFPVVLLVKTPPLTLTLGLLTALGLLMRRLPSRGRRSEAALLAFPLFYFAVSMASDINIGYRHILPLLPFLFVWISRLATVDFAPAWRWGARLALLGYALVALHTFPWYLSYFNSLIGGTENGWRYVTDSNTDWGQGYKALAAYQQTHHVGQVALSTFLTYDPAAYGVDYTPLTPMYGDTPSVFPSRLAPPPGDYAISLTPLDGVPLSDPEMYDWFRWRKPDAQIAHALAYFHVTAQESRLTWLAQCITPTIPLDEGAIAAGFGSRSLRRVDFDCTHSWLIPPDAGVFVIHGALLRDTRAARLHLAPPPARDPFLARRLAEARITYRQRAYRDVPAFAVYRAAPPHAPLTEVRAAAAATAPRDLVAPLRTSPVPLDGALTFLGAAAHRETDALDVETWWLVTGFPAQASLAVMAHLLTADGQVVANADGLGVPPTAWRPGDVIIQRHRFPVADAGASYTLRTGIYDRQDGHRWTVSGDPSADALFVPLPAER